MAERAIIAGISGIKGTPNVNEMIITFNVYVLEENCPFPANPQIDVLTSWSDTTTQIQAKATAAILNWCSANGYKTLTNIVGNLLSITLTKS